MKVTPTSTDPLYFIRWYSLLVPNKVALQAGLLLSAGDDWPTVVKMLSLNEAQEKNAARALERISYVEVEVT